MATYRMSRACFAAGTPILTVDGSKRIEDIVAGDIVLSRDEVDPDGPVVGKVVEEKFVRVSPVLNVQVRGRVIRTTAEHPFWVKGRTEWVPAKELVVGDVLVTRDGREVPVEAIEDSGEVVTVYNFRVADYYTYFVGCAEWGFDVWAHNACIGNDVQDGLAAVGLKKTNNPTAKKLAGMANDTNITRDELIAEIQRLRPGTNKYQASWLADNLHGKAGRVVGDHPETFLQEALRRQGLTTAPTAAQFKEPQKGMPKWTDGSYNYEVRMHPAEAASVGKTGFIYRVERHNLAVDPVTKQGMGREYLDHNGVWHHTSKLKVDNTAAANTHIQY